MRAAFITTNLAGGGAEKALLNLAAGLAHRGHSASMILLEHRVQHPIPEGVDVAALTPEGGRAPKGWLGKRWSAWRLQRLLRRMEAQQRFDLIVSSLPYADEVVALAGVRRAWFRIANTLSAELERLARQSAARAARRRERYRRLYRGRRLIAVSDGVAEDLRRNLAIEAARIERIYNGFDAERIRGLAQEADPDIPAQPYLLHVGRHAAQKRHDLLFEAFRHSGLPHRLVLLAEPSPALARQIEKSGLDGRVTIAGFRNNPYPWMARAELLVLSSDHEGLPNVLIEALLCGTRVVSTDCPSGPREVLRGELAACLVPCNDPQALARALRAALDAPRPSVRSVRELLAPFAAASVLAQYEALAGS